MIVMAVSFPVLANRGRRFSDGRRSGCQGRCKAPRSGARGSRFARANWGDRASLRAASPSATLGLFDKSPSPTASPTTAKKEAPAARTAGAAKGDHRGRSSSSLRGLGGLVRLLGTAEELDVVGNDLVAVAVDAVLVGPLAVVDPAANRDEHSLAGMLGDHAPEAVEAGYPMPLGILGGEAAFVLVGLTFAVAFGPAGAEAEAGDIGAAIGGAKLGIGAEIADEENDIGHCQSPECRRRDRPVDSPHRRGEAAARTAGEAQGEPEDRGRRGQPEGQHGPMGRGLRVRRGRSRKGWKKWMGPVSSRKGPAIGQSIARCCPRISPAIHAWRTLDSTPADVTKARS